MSKTGSKQAEGPSYRSFEAEAAEQLRSFAHKGVEQGRQAYEQMKDGSEHARKAFETSFEIARALSDELVLKSLEAAEAGTEAHAAHIEKLAGAKSLSDVAELQSDFVRRQMEFAANQTRAFHAIFQTAGMEFSRPVRDLFDKAVKQTAA